MHVQPVAQHIGMHTNFLHLVIQSEKDSQHTFTAMFVNWPFLQVGLAVQLGLLAATIKVVKAIVQTKCENRTAVKMLFDDMSNYSTLI